MPTIDIPVPDDVRKLLETPKCVDLSLKKVTIPSITLPTGSSLKGLADITKAIPTDCSLTFSLLLQIGPILASMECLLKILKLLGPLVSAVTSPPPGPDLVKKIVEAAADLGPCLAIPTGANLLYFVRDLLCLILKLLKCAVGSLKSIANLMTGLTLSLNAAEADGNEELLATLKCAQDNAAAQADTVLTSIQPLAVLLELASPVMAMAGVGQITIPTVGGAGDAESLMQVVTALEGVIEIIQSAVDAIGGCP